MSDTTNPTPVAVNAHSPSLVPVDVWWIDSTSQHVAMRLVAEGSPDAYVATGKHGFLMELEQARQLIRDLSSAVLASDLKRTVEADDAK